MFLPADDYHAARLLDPPRPPTGADAIIDAWRGRAQTGRGVTDAFRRRGERVVTAAGALTSLGEEALTAALKTIAERFRRNSVDDATLDQALAHIGEASRRSLGMAPYAVQMTAALALNAGHVAEMATGEGKSLTAAVTAVLAGWTGRPCHVVTANDYLAQRDADEMRPLFDRCGVSLASVVGDTDHGDRRRRYGHDVVYVTSKELVGDFLRDVLKLGGRGAAGRRLIQRLLQWPHLPGHGLTLRGLATAIVDEADSVLIDQGVTPFLLSAPSDNPALVEAVRVAAGIADALVRDRDFAIDGPAAEVRLTARGAEAVREAAATLGGMWRGATRREELVLQALYARHILQRDRHYVVIDGRVVLIDEPTGRLTPDRTLGIGLHQALEAAAGIDISSPVETLARFSFQKFFRLFPRLCGMSGTVSEVTGEFWRMYRLAIVRIPTRRPVARQQMPMAVFAREQDRWAFLLDEIATSHAKGRPVLVGIASVEDSETLAGLLTARGLSCALLNAVRHRDEAQIVAAAGRPGRITIATNMAGRGTDIKLTDDVRAEGGLHVIVGEPNETARSDRQLFGRSGRQGDPGSVRLVLTLEDRVVVRHVPALFRHLLRRWLAHGVPGSRRAAAWTLALAQGRAERKAYGKRRGIVAADQWFEDFLAFPDAERPSPIPDAAEPQRK